MRSQYKTKPLEKGLKSAFGQHSYLYGGSKPDHSTSIRVAVTATLASENRPAVLSNYNTESDNDSSKSKLPVVFTLNLWLTIQCLTDLSGLKTLHGSSRHGKLHGQRQQRLHTSNRFSIAQLEYNTLMELSIMFVRYLLLTTSGSAYGGTPINLLQTLFSLLVPAMRRFA